MIDMLTEQHGKDMVFLSQALGKEIWKPETILRAAESLEKTLKCCDETIKRRAEVEENALYEAAVNARYVLLPNMQVIRDAATAIKEGGDYNPLVVGAAIITCTMAQSEIRNDYPKPY